SKIVGVTSVWQAPPGWPTPPPGWAPPPGWQPDPTWLPAPPGWTWWRSEPVRRRASTRWFIAAGACAPVSFVLLIVGLEAKGLTIVYLSIAISVLWLPLLIVGLVLLALET